MEDHHRRIVKKSFEETITNCQHSAGFHLLLFAFASPKKKERVDWTLQRTLFAGSFDQRKTNGKRDETFCLRYYEPFIPAGRRHYTP